MGNRVPQLMGILNVTPDSFFDGGAYFSPEKAILRGRQLWEEGSDIIDIGGASSRPGASFVEEEEEIRRAIPIIEALSKIVPIPLSIDTNRPKVARMALEAGASFINDISGFTHPEMREIASHSNADLCVMHAQGTPSTMQINPSYPEGVVPHLMHFFEKQIKLLTDLGIKEERIILDPGIGFGKTVEHNISILKAIPEFKRFGLRVLIGASRKGFMRKILNKTSSELLPATLGIHTICMVSGADIIRVHDVKEHKDIISIYTHV